MRFNRSITSLSAIAAIAALVATGALANAGPERRAKAHQQENAQELVRDVVRNEIGEQNGSPIYWHYLQIDTACGASKLFDVYETKSGTVKRLLAVNGEPLSPAESRSEDVRLERILNHPSQAREAAKQVHQDGERERRLLAMLPNAFIFQYDGNLGDLVRLQFRPNPRFNPPTREAEVFHHMEGHLLVDPGQKRLAEIDGRLMTEVKFLWGLLGYLDKGGTFLVKQSDIEGTNWEMTQLTVNMNSKALFFKTIGVQENEHIEDYRENPPGMTLQQAVDQLEKATVPPHAAMG